MRAGLRVGPGEGVQSVARPRLPSAGGRRGGTRPRRCGGRNGRASAARARSRSRAGPTPLPRRRRSRRARGRGPRPSRRPRGPRASLRTRSCSNTLQGSSGGTWLSTSWVGPERVRCGSATAIRPQLYRRRYPCAQGMEFPADTKSMAPDGSTAFMLRGLIEGRGLHSAYQPIVDIGSLAVRRLRGTGARARGFAAGHAGRVVRRGPAQWSGRRARPRLPRGGDRGRVGKWNRGEPPRCS